jgi:hypothetical protein
MHADQPKPTPILAFSFVMFIVILIILWSDREWIGFIVVGLGVLAVLVLLGIRIMEAMAEYQSKSADTKDKYNEQGLRRRRLRPFRGGKYEIPLDNDKTYMPPLQKRRQESYSEGYDGDDPKDSDSYRDW